MSQTVLSEQLIVCIIDMTPKRPVLNMHKG